MVSRNELEQIIAMADDAERLAIPCALVTVVAVRGSTYRRPGARMLIRGDCVVVGGVSGGCLDTDVIRKARMSLIDKKPKIHVYDTTDEDDSGLGSSLNCRGEITVLIEPIVTERAKAHLARLLAARHSTEPAVNVLNISPDRDPATVGVIPPESIEYAELEWIVSEVLAERRYKNVSMEDGRELLFDYLPPAAKLVLFGAGPEAVTIASLARALGCELSIVDERPGYISRHSFPAGLNLSTANVDEVASSRQNLDSVAACIIATHNAAYDKRVLRMALATGCPYVGLLGPRQRALSLMEALRSEGFSDADLQRIYSPVGLDLGAETPEQVALAIVAEIHAVLAGRDGGSLRQRRTPLHDVPTEAHVESADV